MNDPIVIASPGCAMISKLTLRDAFKKTDDKRGIASLCIGGEAAMLVVGMR